MAERPKAGSGPWRRRAPATAEKSPPPDHLTATDFLAAQKANRRNTDLLIVLLLLIGAAFGYVLGWALEAGFQAEQPTDPFRVSQAGMLGAIILTGIGVIASLVAVLAGDRVMLAMTGANEVSADQEPVLHNVVEEMAIAAGLPKPRVTVIETEALNAFATGMHPDRAAIGVTRGLLKTLNREELQGVVAHEMGHIANWDIRYMTAVAILVGLIVLVADGVRRSLFYGVRPAGRRRGKGGAGVLVVVLLVFAILAPLAAQLVRFAVSRQREYLADATAVQFTRNPLGLISALGKLATAAQPFRGANRATQHMFIVNPFRNFSADASALVATHPPIEQRIARLRNLEA
jgi:heat shock protein HtpX